LCDLRQENFSQAAASLAAREPLRRLRGKGCRLNSSFLLLEVLSDDDSGKNLLPDRFTPVAR
jgi:hypothetical protein